MLWSLNSQLVQLGKQFLGQQYALIADFTKAVLRYLGLREYLGLSLKFRFLGYVIFPLFIGLRLLDRPELIAKRLFRRLRRWIGEDRR